jgi:ABC-type ATPase involved in cell division
MINYSDTLNKLRIILSHEDSIRSQISVALKSIQNDAQLFSIKIPNGQKQDVGIDRSIH